MNKIKLLLFFIVSLFLVSCSDDKDQNTWVVATSADNPPYEYIKEGNIEGFDIDLIIEVAHHLGKKVEFKNMDFHGLLASLSTRNVDMVIAGMSITPERQARVDFSIPYTEAKIAVLFRREDAFRAPEDLKNKNIGAQLGTIWSLIAHDMSIIYSFKPKALANNLMIVEELKLKRLDAMVLEESQAQKFIEKNPQLSSFSLPQYSSSFAIAFPKGSKNIKNINHTLRTFKSRGTISALEKKWGIVSEE